MTNNYKKSGVDITKGYETVDRIKKHIDKTNNLGTISNIGSFGGCFDLSKYNMKNPVLVSGTDGVGTKLLIAQEANIHNTIGIDLVAMCVNDVITTTATPLFFLDYIATGKLQPEIVEEVIKGITLGCIESGCALIGGETAEMPDMYTKNHYDLAGYVTGVVEKESIIDINRVNEKDIIIGITSNGLHSNGFSLVRKILFKDNNLQLDDYIEELNCSLKEELLKPTHIYVKPIQAIKDQIHIKSIAHITGGGFIENIPRAIPKNLGVTIIESSIHIHPIFYYLEKLGKIPHQEMFNIFNMGIGMIVIVSKEDSKKTINLINKSGFSAKEIGFVTNQPGVNIL